MIGPKSIRYHGPCDGCCVPAIEAVEKLEAELQATYSAGSNALARAEKAKAELSRKTSDLADMNVRCYNSEAEVERLQKEIIRHAANGCVPCVYLWSGGGRESGLSLSTEKASGKTIRPNNETAAIPAADTSGEASPTRVASPHHEHSWLTVGDRRICANCGTGEIITAHKERDPVLHREGA